MNNILWKRKNEMTDLEAMKVDRNLMGKKNVFVTGVQYMNNILWKKKND